MARQPIFILKHELHSAWPIFNIPETRHSVHEGLELTVTRPTSALGPTDTMEISATLRSMRPKPLKLRAFSVELVEIIVTKSSLAGTKSAPLTKTKVIQHIKVPVAESIARTEEKCRVLRVTMPATGPLQTVQGATTLSIDYEMTVTAVMEGTTDVKIEHLRTVLGVYERARAIETVE